jgi:AcrR family transcriptional regulator
VKSGTNQSKLEGRRRAADKASNDGYNQRRRELAEIAGRLFMKKGYDATTLGDISEAAGIDRATFYYYFKSKSELVQAAINDVVETSMAEIHLAKESDAPARVRVGLALSRLMTSFVAAYPWGVLYLHDDIWRSRDADAAWVKKIRANETKLQQTIFEMVSDGQGDGSIRADLEAELITRTLVGTVFWGCRQFRSGGSNADVARLSAVVDAMLFDGLVPREPAGRSARPGPRTRATA